VQQATSPAVDPVPVAPAVDTASARQAPQHQSNAFGNLARAIGSALTGSTKEASVLVTYEKLNFRFRPPAGAWSTIDAKRLNAGVTVAYSSRNLPDAMLTIIGERLGIELGADADSLTEVTRQRMQSLSSDYRRLDKRPLSLSGVSGVRIVDEATIRGIPIVYVRWLSARNGFFYQFVIAGRPADRDRLEVEADQAFQGFEVVDPEMVCHVEQPAAAQDFLAPEDGFSMRLADLGWRGWDRLGEVFPSAQFGALLGNDLGLLIIPIRFHEMKPSEDARTVAFLAINGCANPQLALASCRTARVCGAEATECSFERAMQSGTLYYRLCVVHRNDCDYCFTVWSAKSSQQAASALGDVLDRAIFQATPPPPGGAVPFPGESMRTAKFYNFAGLHLYNTRQFLESEPCFLKALDSAPNMTEALSNYVHACVESSRSQPALDAMQQYKDAWRGDGKLGLLHAWLLSKVNRSAESLDEYAGLFQSKLRDDVHLCEYVRLLEDAGQGETAQAAIEKYLAGGDSLIVVLTKARMLSRQGKHDAAIDLLKSRQAQSPGNADIVFALIESLRNADRFAEAHSLAAQLVADGRETSDALVVKGMLELQLKWYKEAKSTFETALRRTPGNQRIQDYLNQVSGILGEGANVDLKDPVAAVELPPEARLDGGPPLKAEGLSGAPAYYRGYARAIEYVPGKTYRATTYRSIEVLNEAGVERFSTVLFDFDPLVEKIYVNRLEVFDEQGNVIAKGDVADYFVADAGESDVASHRKALHVPIPGIRAGCRIELYVTTEDFVAPKRLPYVEHLFCASVPTKRQTLWLAANPEDVLWAASAGLQPQHLQQGLCWQIDAPPVLRFEPEADDLDSFLPALRLVDKQSNWKDEVEEYRKAIEGMLAPSSEVRKLASDLTAGISDPGAKTAALVEFVRKQVTYKAIEFGRRARVMNSAERTLHNRYGDCKDHSLLLCQLLQAIGQPARLALVHTSSGLASETPSLDQFNHMIVYLQGSDGGKFIDATDKELDCELLCPYGLAGRQALVLEWGNPQLVRIPDYPVESNTLNINREARIGSDGVVTLQDQLTYGGYYAGAMRHYFKAIEPSQRKAAWQAAFGGDRDLQIEDLTVDGVEDRKQRVVVAVKYKVQHALQLADNQLVGRLPAPWESSILAPERNDHRESPLRLQFPLHLTMSAGLEAPSGFRLPPAGSLTASGDTGMFREKRDAQIEGDKLMLQCDAARSAGKFPASFYSSYCDQLEQARQVFTPNLVLKPIDAAGSSAAAGAK